MLKCLRSGLLCGCCILLAGAPAHAATTPAATGFLDRVTWGVNEASVRDLTQMGQRDWLEQQLRAPAAPLPAAAQAQSDAMRISREPMAQLVVEMDAQNRAANTLTDPDQRKAARDAYNKDMAELGRQAQARSLLRDLYAPGQLREQMTWFWFNHFNVQAGKRDIRTMVADYEDQAIRPRALGRFRDLLEATLRHPAMLRYLDNDQNAVGHINENYAREIMELHSMGVGSGYSQKDVQELARILTGVGVDLKPDAPKLKPQWQPLYVREGLFEFNPARHDFGDKQFLGHTIKGSGFHEVEQALDLIAASPATAHHVSLQLATYFTGDNPPPALVDRMAASFQHSNGDIAAVLRVLLRSGEFTASLGKQFKDPMHYAVSAVRLAYGDRVVLNTDPLNYWLQRMGEGSMPMKRPMAMRWMPQAGPAPARWRPASRSRAPSAAARRGCSSRATAASPSSPPFPRSRTPCFTSR
jgi:uncharacterized protein (DUF1800 family)